MDIFELADTLPNGFHDAVLSEVTISWTDRVAQLKLAIWCGAMDGPADLRESYRPAELTLRGVEYFVIQPPDPSYPYMEQAPVTIDLAVAGHSMELTPKSGVAFRFWVGQWNAFMNICAAEAQLQWVGAEYVRHA